MKKNLMLKQFTIALRDMTFEANEANWILFLQHALPCNWGNVSKSPSQFLKVS